MRRKCHKFSVGKGGYAVDPQSFAVPTFTYDNVSMAL